MTLVEVLALIAVIGILIALLVPAIQAAREAARRDLCINKLRWIGLAVHSVESSHNRLPWNQWSEACGAWDMGGGFGWSWLTFLLPYMEEGELYDRLDVRNNSPAIADAMLARPNWFVCPNYGGQSYQDPVAGLGGISTGTTRAWTDPTGATCRPSTSPRAARAPGTLAWSTTCSATATCAA